MVQLRSVSAERPLLGSIIKSMAGGNLLLTREREGKRGGRSSVERTDRTRQDPDTNRVSLTFLSRAIQWTLLARAFVQLFRHAGEVSRLRTGTPVK